tara:strand:+ start:324 stop:497 length:174 start_codon:yes stop_codon:yes gene_type:complete
MKKFLIIIIFIAGCSSNKNQQKNNLLEIKFSDNLSLEEFQIKLDKYANNNPYPNINN